MTRLRTALLALAFVASGCGGPRPTVVVPLVIEWGGDFALLVYDASGLVTGARQAENPSFGLDSATARPGQSEIDVSWIGGACSHRPTASVSGTAEAFRIEITNVADTNLVPFLPIACPAVGLPFTVTLSLSAPVAQDALAFEFTP
jgi:hypothetical protein